MLSQFNMDCDIGTIKRTSGAARTINIKSKAMVNKGEEENNQYEEWNFESQVRSEIRKASKNLLNKRRRSSYASNKYTEKQRNNEDVPINSYSFAEMEAINICLEEENKSLRE